MNQLDLLTFAFHVFKSDLPPIGGYNITDSKLSNEQPRLVYDIDGSIIFNDFLIIDNSGFKLGYIRSSGLNKQLPLIDSIYIGLKDIEDQDVRTGVINKYPDIEVINVGDYVCYAYPKIGRVVTYTENGKQMKAIADVYSFRLYLKQKIEINFEDEIVSEEKEGVSVFSLKARLLEAGGGEDTTNDWTIMQELFQEFTLTTHRFLEKTNLLENNEYNKLPMVSGATIPVSLIAQETEWFCAVATAQMALFKYGYDNLDQRAIADAMNTDESGTTNINQKTGVINITHNTLLLEIDGTPTFEEVVDNISHGHIIKSGIYGHARLLRGWRKLTFSGNIPFEWKFYLINDPYPTNNGSYVLENTDKPFQGFYNNMMVFKRV